MSKSIIVEGKTSVEAIEKGLKELNCKKDDVEIKVLENEDKRSFYSILAPRIVKVEITLKNEEKVKTVKNEEKNDSYKEASQEEMQKCKEQIDLFLNNFLKTIGNVEFTTKIDKDFVDITVTGEDSSKLIGYRGDVINALQNIISAIGNRNIEHRVKVSLDIGNYKEKREETLKELASKLERTVKKTGKKVVLEPMSAYERKIIHTELQNSEFVTTYSIGEEPHRKIVVDKK
jgi:spoIIIJ-associated protein